MEVREQYKNIEEYTLVEGEYLPDMEKYKLVVGGLSADLKEYWMVKREYKNDLQKIKMVGGKYSDELEEYIMVAKVL